jgi:putative endopeptidase
MRVRVTGLLLSSVFALHGVARADVAAELPIVSLPYTPGLDLQSMDKSANPCADFYQYTCGGWIKHNPIPADQAAWSVYGKLTQDNQRFLWGILDELAKQKTGRTAPQQKIGDYFAACMDEGAVEKAGLTPVKPYLEQIAALKAKTELPALLADFHLRDLDDAYFNFGSNQDFGDSSQVIAFASAGGLGLPDRDYYTKTDKHSIELRDKYLVHVAHMLTLVGAPAADATRDAKKIMEMETTLAKATLTQVELRDPYKSFHKMDDKQLRALTPDFNWDAYLKQIAMSDLHTFNVTQPAFYQAFDKLLVASSIDDIKLYLKWHLIHSVAGVLSKPFVEENFDFYSKTLRGVPQQKPRWKRCVSLVDRQLGEALGEEFVRRAFAPALKAKTLKITTQIERAMEEDIKSLTWMSAPTKAQALLKLHAIVNKIGYPDKWRDYSSVQVKPNDFAGNAGRAALFESKRQLAKIGKPLDRTEWNMTPPTVNAYFDPQMGDINFPAGVLQPPLYDPKMDDPPNYGNTGGTIGHELTHGFDDEGRQFDAKGNLKDWWTAEDAKHFEERAQCIVDQYAQYTIVDDIKLNSKLTQGEDIADLGGLMLAHMAYKAQEKEKPARKDGLSGEQRFFVGYAQWACENERPENLRANAITNPHSPGKYRVNGLVVNMPEFQKAFSCKAGDAMVKQNTCRVW